MKFLLIFIFLCFYNISFAQPLIPFLQDTLYGYSDVNGKLIIKPQYDEAFLFDTTYSYAQVRMQDKYYVINRKGQKLDGVEMDCKIEFEMLRKPRADIKDGRRLHKRGEREENPSTSNIIIVKKSFHCRDNCTVYKVFNPEKFQAIEIAAIADRRQCLWQETYSIYANDYLFAGLGDGIFNVYDKNLNFCIKSSIQPRFISKQEIQFLDKVGYIYNTEQKSISKIPFKYVLRTNNKNRFIFCTENNPSIFGYTNSNKCGVCDKDYNIIIDSIYYSISTLDNYFLGIRMANTYVTDLINEEGKVILKAKSSVRGLKDNGVITVTDTTGEISIYDQSLSRLKLKDPSSFTWNKYDSHYHYKNGDFSSLLDSNLNVVFECRAESITPFGKNFIFIKNKKYGIVSADKTIISPNIYKNIHRLQYGYTRVETFRRKLGLLKENGQILLDTIFDEIEIDSNFNQVYINNGSVKKRHIFVDKEVNA